MRFLRFLIQDSEGTRCLSDKGTWIATPLTSGLIISLNKSRRGLVLLGWMIPKVVVGCMRAQCSIIPIFLGTIFVSSCPWETIICVDLLKESGQLIFS